MPNPKVWCNYDRCHQFDPQSHNARYCVECKCKRKAENAKKRLTVPVDSDEELWGLQERKKESNYINAQAKNEWLLENSKFGSFDIETTNLDASIGMILCACIKIRGGETTTYVAKPINGMINSRF